MAMPPSACRLVLTIGIVLPAHLMSARADGERPRSREIAPGIHVLQSSARFQSANMGWLVAEDQVLLIGAPAEAMVGEALAEIEAVARKPARLAILPQLREGEVAAARLLLRQGVRVLAQKEAMAALRAALGAEARPALLEEVGARLELKLGGRTVELHGWDLAAGAGNLAVHVRGAEVLFTGELCTNGPRAELERAHTGAWLAALLELEKLPVKHLVPGFGSLGEGNAALVRMARFLRELRRQVAYQVAQEVTLLEIEKRVHLAPEWLLWMPYDQPVAADIAHVHRELTVPEAPYGRRPFLMGERPPRALALIGDRFHDPEHLEAGLSRAFQAARIEARFAVDVRALAAANLEPVQILVILRDGMTWPKGGDQPYRVWMAPEQERAVADFVEKGGGLLALHNSTGLYPEGGAYLKLLGGTYNGHGPLERFRVRPLPVEHPVTKGIESFEIADEQHTPIPDRSLVRVLLESHSDEGVVAAAGWVREVGRGRVCYLANGHTREALVHPMYQKLLENALRWSLGASR